MTLPLSPPPSPLVRQITQDEVLAKRDALPPFPRVIDDILATLEMPDTNMNLLVEQIGRDPVIAARVFAQAGAAASHTRRDAGVRDLFTATSLIGLSRLRNTVLTSCLAGFLHGALPPGLAPGFWEHSAATGVAAQQLAMHVRQPGDAALIAGLLHDIGQLWLARIEPEGFSAIWRDVVERKRTIEEAEAEYFGVDHTQIGAWLLESWELPAAVCAAVRYHHAPDDDASSDLLVPLVHVAEVLSNALDVSRGDSARVTYLSAKSCAALKLDWDESAAALFGRIDAVSHFVANYFKP
jgi:putative nucleotidyltransferase with HDIG domain